VSVPTRASSAGEGPKRGVSDAARDAAIGDMRRRRPRSRVARVSAFVLAALVAYAWGSGAFHFSDLTTERARTNVQRFLNDVRPYPLQGRDWDWTVYGNWLRSVLADSAPRALFSTLALAVAAIVLAGAAAIVLSLAAARNVATPEPFVAGARPPSTVARLAWGALVVLSRFVLIFLRAIPEYIWAFLLLTLLGVGAWPAVLALAIHNAGILGKLYADVAENMEPSAPRALRALGARRSQIAFAAIFPNSLGRYLLYFFYRWETCVREATVLGLLGFVSLGWFIQQARAGARYDDMLHFVLLGSLLILAGDVVSSWVRRFVR
jgi:phosphonate transport system permease protein